MRAGQVILHSKEACDVCLEDEQPTCNHHTIDYSGLTIKQARDKKLERKALVLSKLFHIFKFMSWEISFSM
jgi:hypothetical protein